MSLRLFLLSRPQLQLPSGYLHSVGNSYSSSTLKFTSKKDATPNVQPITINRQFSSTTAMAEPPSKVDVCIVGGGVMGSSTAYWLKQRFPGKKLNVLVVEKDPSYSKCSTVLSLGGVRQQFSLEENIRMSMFGADFLRNAADVLAVDKSDKPNLQFNQYGYLYMSTQQGAEQLKENWDLQSSLGAKVVLLSQKQLGEKFSWINTEGVDIAAFGLDNEGWFDPEALLQAFKKKAISLGAEYVQADVVGFETSDLSSSVNSVVIKNLQGDMKVVEFDQCVISGGHASGKIAALAKIGTGHGLLQTPLPVELRKRYVYCIHAPKGPLLDCPLGIDPTGTYFRREGMGNLYLVGQSPNEEEEPSTENFDVDYSFFEEKVWPVLANRVPAFENIKLKTSWSGFYDYNTVDQNAIVGPHPYYKNLFFTCGFSGHGIQQSPAVGRATMELLLDQKYQTIDLTRFHFDRFVAGTEMREKNII